MKKVTWPENLIEPIVKRVCEWNFVSHSG